MNDFSGATPIRGTRLCQDSQVGGLPDLVQDWSDSIADPREVRQNFARERYALAGACIVLCHQLAHIPFGNVELRKAIFPPCFIIVWEVHKEIWSGE